MLSYEGTCSRLQSLCIRILIWAHSALKRRIWKSTDKDICRGWDSMCHRESYYWVGVDEWLEWSVVGWGRFWHWNPSDRVASRFAGSFQAERILSQTQHPFSALIEGIFYSSTENMLMKYKSFSLISGLPLLPICALTDGWAIEAAENQNKRGECWDFGGGGGLECNFIKQGCVTGCLKEWKV